MDFKTAVTTCFRKYATFHGRARRSEYWWFQLFLAIAGVASGIADAIVSAPLAWFAFLVLLVSFLPSLAVFVRRLHDVDRSGWWVLLFVVPLIGPIALFIFVLSRGTDGPNRFGDPVVA
jgi:uncharacterized membrane protein YhaH (DUF805 family)